MSEKKADKAPKKSWFKGLQAEYKKIIWPDRNTLVKQTTAVIVVSFILGVLITLVDVLAHTGIELLVR